MTLPPFWEAVGCLSLLCRAYSHKTLVSGVIGSLAEEVEESKVEEVKAEEAKPEAVNTAKKFTGVIVKWKFAKTPDTALALLDAPNGKNQAFVTGKTPEIQKELTELADNGKTIEAAGDYIAGKIPPVFEVSAIVKK